MTKSIDIACTLGVADLRAQARHWQRLMARALTERSETADGLRLTFRPEAEDELRALVAVEAGCCAWAAWTVEPTDGGGRARRPFGRRGHRYVARHVHDRPVRRSYVCFFTRSGTPGKSAMKAV